MIRKTLLIIGLLAALTLTACNRTVSSPDAEVAIEPTTVASAPEAEAPVADEPAPTEAVAVETEAPAEEPAAVPTSRGAELAATDPNSVVLASGTPQLIEFFAFW